MRRALILGGTGALGRASAIRLTDAGWAVTVTARDESKFEPALRERGVTFLASDRHDRSAFLVAVGEGTDLLVDCACYDDLDATSLLEVSANVGSFVMISSKAVYVDERGRHSNSVGRPDYGGPVSEGHATLAPRSGRLSYEFYGAHKVAAERVLLESGVPVSILRPSKVHGVGSRLPREWYFVKRVLDGRTVLPLARRGEGVEHQSAALNVAALIEVVAAAPAARVLNCADPDTPNVLEMSRVVARHLSHQWRERLLDAVDGPGVTPWDRVPAVVLDTSAARSLGYVPVGDYATTVRSAVLWLRSIAVRDGEIRLPEEYDNAYFKGRFDYRAEDALIG